MGIDMFSSYQPAAHDWSSMFALIPAVGQLIEKMTHTPLTAMNQFRVTPTTRRRWQEDPSVSSVPAQKLIMLLGKIISSSLCHMDGLAGRWYWWVVVVPKIEDDGKFQSIEEIRFMPPRRAVRFQPVTQPVIRRCVAIVSCVNRERKHTLIPATIRLLS